MRREGNPSAAKRRRPRRFLRNCGPGMAFHVKFLPRAKQDLETIYRRVIQEAPLKGTEWFNGLQRSIDSLSHLPERCPVSPKLSTTTDTVRRFFTATIRTCTRFTTT